MYLSVFLTTLQQRQKNSNRQQCRKVQEILDTYKFKPSQTIFLVFDYPVCYLQKDEMGSLDVELEAKIETLRVGQSNISALSTELTELVNSVASPGESAGREALQRRPSHRSPSEIGAIRVRKEALCLSLEDGPNGQLGFLYYFRELCL